MPKPHRTAPKNQFGIWPIVLSGLSFIPLCGVPIGVLAIVWGLFAKQRSGKVVALMGGLGIGLTIVLYSSLYYFGFMQRGGLYDGLRAKLAVSNLTQLVQALEFYKLQNTAYPATLAELAAAQPTDQPVFITDPTSMVGPGAPQRSFYYALAADGAGYYLLGVGPDATPFTPDDLLPTIDTKNTGLLINPASQPAP